MINFTDRAKKIKLNTTNELFSYYLPIETNKLILHSSYILFFLEHSAAVKSNLVLTFVLCLACTLGMESYDATVSLFIFSYCSLWKKCCYLVARASRGTIKQNNVLFGSKAKLWGAVSRNWEKQRLGYVKAGYKYTVLRFTDFSSVVLKYIYS